LEVSGRPVQARGRLRTSARAWALPAVALGASLAAALLIVAAQPVRSPWWTYADADATYVGAGLNLLLGEPVHYLDHPGLPLEQLVAGVFGAGEAFDRVTGASASTKEYVDGLMLHLDRARPVFRTLAVLFYLAGSVLSVLLFARLFGHWGWGLAGGLAWVAAPGLPNMSIQYRPDVALSVLCLVFAFLVGRAVQTRSAWLFVAAGAELGLTMMVKLHAAGLLPALLLAAVWRHPAAGWWDTLLDDGRAWLRRNRAWLAALAVVLAVLAIVLNTRRLPFDLTGAQAVAGLVPVLLVADFLGLAWLVRWLGAPRWLRVVFDPFYGVVGLAVLAGLALPVALSIPDGLQALVSIEKGLTGQGVNETIPAFSAPLDRLLDPPLRQALLVFVLAGAAALVGLVKREPLPVVWFVGAAVLGVMAEARLAAVHYFAPAYVVSLWGAFWLIRRAHSGTAPIIAAVLVAYVAWPAVRDRHALQYDPGLAAVAAPTLRALEARLGPNELALTPSYWPDPDTRYFDVVQPYVAYTPAYPYRFLSDSGRAPTLAEERGMRLRYYTGPLARNFTGTRLTLQEIGTYSARPVPGVPDAVELLSGPGTGR
jgi:hypothetical protein